MCDELKFGNFFFKMKFLFLRIKLFSEMCVLKILLIKLMMCVSNLIVCMNGVGDRRR